MEQINLDLIPGKVKPVCHASQYDIGRIIRLNLYMDGLPYTLTGTETISIMLRKSNFVVIIEEVTNTSSSYVEIETTENTCDVSGEYECELRVEDNEINIGSANFKMVVEPDAFDGQLAIGTASGKIASFYTSLEEDLVENKIIFSATQDLHGQDKPYPAGGGKNKFSIDFLTASGITISNGEASSSAYTFADKFGATKLIPQLTLGTNTQYTLSFDAYTDGNTSTSGNGLYVAFKYDDDSTTPVRCPNNTSSYKRFTISNDTSKNLVGIFISYNSISSNIWHLRNIQLEEGSPATAYAPYENICPIVGVDKVKVVNFSVNIWNEDWETGGYDLETGEKVASTVRIRNKNLIPVKPNIDIYIVVPIVIRLFYYGKDKEYVGYSTGNGLKTVPNDTYYLAFQMGSTQNPYQSYDNDISFNYPNTETEYHAFNGTTALIDLGDTYYGGTLDVVARKMIIDKNIIVIDGSQTLNISSQSYIKPLSCDCYINNDDIYPRVAAQSQPDNFAYCDKLKPVKKSIWNVDGDINCMTINTRQIHLNIANELLGITDYTQETIETVKTKMQAFLQNNPVTVVFCINPVIIDLTEENIYEVSGSTVQFETKISKPIKTVETNFVFSQASGTPTPTTPLPITGYNKLAVCRCGKNLVDLSSMVFGYVTGTGTFATVHTQDEMRSDFIPVKPNTTYTFAIKETSSSYPSWCGIGLYRDNNIGSFIVRRTNLWTFTTTEDTRFIVVSARNIAGASQIQLEQGSESTDYEPYNGTIALINLGGTYYGGTLDTETGKLTLTHEGLKLSDAHLGWSSSNNCFSVNKSVINAKTGTSAILKCSCYQYANTATTDLTIWQTNNGIRLRDDNYSGNLTAFLAAVGNEIMVYELDTPVEIYISDTAEIPTIVGKNIVFTDAGDVRVEYYDAPAPNPIYITTLNGENNIYSDTNGDITVKYYKNIND